MNKQKIEEDKKLLLAHGGYSQVAQALGTSPQRVFNWSKRGIPSKVKLDFPSLFLDLTKIKK